MRAPEPAKAGPRADPPLGFWRNVCRHSSMIVVSWDLIWSLLLGVVGGCLATDNMLIRIKDVASLELGVASALLGVILAGLAIVVVFLDKGFLLILMKVGHGLGADLFPFWYTAALAVLSIMLSLATVLIDPASVGWKRLFLGLGLWFFLYTLFASLNLVALVVGHGQNRARQILKSQDRSDGAP